MTLLPSSRHAVPSPFTHVVEHAYWEDLIALGWMNIGLMRQPPFEL
jgi:hypothetical protein